MELLLSLLKLFDKVEKNKLIAFCKAEKAMHFKLILKLIQKKNPNEKELIRNLKTTKKNYHKTCTIAKDFLQVRLADICQTPFDEIYVLQKLLLIGEYSAASKIYVALEKKYLQQQAWSLLDVLYIEGFRMCHILGDTKKMQLISVKRSKNAKRQAEYVILYSDIMIEMVHLEGFKMRNLQVEKYTQKLQQLYQRATAINHHILIHNALHLQYSLTMRYTDNPEKAFSIIKKINTNVDNYQKGISPITKAIAQNNHINFLTIYAGFGSPVLYAEKTKKTIHYAGQWAFANLCYSMTEFHLFEKNMKAANEWLQLVENTEDRSKFSQYSYLLLAIKKFIEKDISAFRKSIAHFYKNPAHLGFPDMEVCVRILELLLFFREKNIFSFQSKAASLRVYMDRNLNKERYNEDRKMLQLLVKSYESANRKEYLKQLEPLHKSAYRNVRFISKLISNELTSHC
ncbi:MAG TPA: hypothetical protein VNG53_07125 [Bacteroidia bacterium]|nr:hypothetical protein [Bacteroidia bacterium]